MDFLRAATLAEALELKARRPDALPIAGGTDVMVKLNFDRRRPGALLDLSRIAELTTWSRTDGHVRLGAGVPYARIAKELADVLPGLAIASRSIGSPQIRSRGTVGGNLGSASPAGDAHPPLLASGAAVEAASMRGVRQVPIDEFFTGVRRNALEPDELIVAVHVPVSDGPQQFAKVGTRKRDGHRGLLVRGGAAPVGRERQNRHRFCGADTRARSRGRGLCCDRDAGPESVGAGCGATRRRRGRLRRIGRGRGRSDRRCARNRGLPPARSLRDRTPRSAVGLRVVPVD